MNFRYLMAAVIFSCATASANFSQATVITFDSVSSSGNPILTTLTTDGFEFTSGHFHTVDSFTGLNVDNGTIYISEEAGTSGLPITMAKVGGGTFSLTGFDGAEVFLGNSIPDLPNATNINLVGTLSGGGVITATCALDGVADGPGGVADFQACSLSGFTDLTSVTFSGAALQGTGGVSLDNLVVDGSSAVPEPQSLILLASGLAMLLGYSRRKK